MEYTLLWQKINLLFKWKVKGIPHISADFEYNSRTFYVTAEVNKILSFITDENLELNQKLFHKDILKKYIEKAKEKDLDYIQTMFINDIYCFLIDDWDSIVLMLADEY